MGKYSKYTKKYNKTWESLPQFKGWLIEDDEKNMAYCKLCKVKLRPHKTDLQRHAKRKLHLRNVTKCNPVLHKQSTLENVTIVSNKSKEIEIKLAAFVAVHTSIRSIDCLSELLVLTDKSNNSLFENMRLHRTKCAMIIKNVIAPCLKQDLKDDIGDNYYSLLIDESTDITIVKYLCLCIKYFSLKNNKIICRYLALCEITSCTAQNLANAILDFLKKISLKNYGLDIKNLIGLGTDGANNLCGKRHSVYTLLKEKNPKLQLIKCVAHSLHLCASKAAQTLPSSLEFLCKEVYNWFAYSALRRSTYKEIFDIININESNRFHHFLRYSDTRWLARANVVKVITDQWAELKAYFNVVSENSYIVNTLQQMLNDNSLYIYLVIVHSILFNVNIVNLLFQHDNADMFKVHLELYHLLLNFMRIIIKPIFLSDLQDMNYLNLRKISDTLENNLALIDVELLDFGLVYRSAVSNYKVPDAQLTTIKERCRNFILHLCKEVVGRMPENMKLFSVIQYLHPQFCLNQTSRTKFQNIIENIEYNKDIYQLEYEWNNLVNITWDKTSSSEEFWISVYHYKNAGGEKIFINIAEVALSVLSLPLSNASVERVFSHLNIIKNKLRNSINLKLLDSILNIRYHFISSNTCCKRFDVTKAMVNKFNNNI